MAKFLKKGSSTPITEEATIGTSAGAGDSGKLIHLDSGGKLDTSFMPTGFGADTRTVTAGETLAAGDLIYIAAAGTAFKADANDHTKEAIGFVLAGITSAATGTAYFGSGMITGLSGLTPGDRHYLSATTPGGSTTAIPSGAGDIVQQVGKAVSSTELYFEPQPSILLI